MEIKKLKDLEKALKNFEESLKIELPAFPSSIRDVLESGQVQKFEMCYELFWKSGKEFLSKFEGIDAGSPRRVFKALFQLGYLNYDELELCLDMLDDRNLLSHVYRREVIDSILPKLRNYLTLMKSVLLRFKEVENAE
jgi:nucleotidyltransferase substrate binding protein (TIGR01987 family)